METTDLSHPARGITVGLSARLIAAMVALVVLTATAVGMLINWNIQQRAVPRALDRIDLQTQLLAIRFAASVDGAWNDVTTQGRGIEALVRANLAGGLDPVEGLTETQLRERLASRFGAQLSAVPAYHQFRLIGVADGGRELVRVDRNGVDGVTRVVPDGELLQRGGDGCFTDTLALPAGAVLASPIVIAHEHSGPAKRVPVMRVAAPVQAGDGTKFGILIVDVDMRPTFAAIRSAGSLGEIFVVNGRGEYLMHPEPDRELGRAGGRAGRIQDDFPEFADLLERGDTRPAMIRSGHAAFGIGWERVQLPGGPPIAIIEAVPGPQLVAARTAGPSALGALGIAVLAFPLLVLLARSLTRPLVQMTRAAEEFSEGRAIALPTEAGGEVGVLARAFERMAANVREKTEALEHEIEERRRIFDTSIDLILVIDADANFVRVSPSAYPLLGYRPEKMEDRNASEFVFGGDLETLRDQMHLAHAGHQIRNCEIRYRHRDGRIVLLAWTGVWSKASRQYYFIGRDVTVTMTVEEAIRESEEAARNLIHGTLDALQSVEESGVAVDGTRGPK